MAIIITPAGGPFQPTRMARLQPDHRYGRRALMLRPPGTVKCCRQRSALSDLAGPRDTRAGGPHRRRGLSEMDRATPELRRKGVHVHCHQRGQHQDHCSQ